MTKADERRAAMGFVEAVEGRRSVRRFLPDPVPDDDVREMVRLATRAASAGNAQMWRFVAVRDAAVRRAMAAAVAARLDEMAAWPEVAERSAELRAVARHVVFFAEAPLVFAVFALPYESKLDRALALRGVGRDEHDRLRARPDLQSVAAAVQLLVTAAHALGYGACWMTAPVIAAAEIEHLLAAAPEARLAAVVPLGRPAGRSSRTRRRPVAEVLRFV